MKPAILLLLILSSLPSNAMNIAPVPVEVRNSSNSRGMTPRGYEIPVDFEPHPQIMKRNVDRQLSFFSKYLRDRGIKEQTIDMRS